MGVSAAVVGSAVVGAAASSSASGKQADAAGKAADQSAEASAQMRADLQPYNQTGTAALEPLINAMGYMRGPDGSLVYTGSTLHQQFDFNANDLENAPGYQFALQQGLRGTNNALAAQGLGLSGAQAKGLSTFATGLADQTYGENFNRALSKYNTNISTAQNNVNNLQQLVGIGQNSAAQAGSQGIQAANNIGNYQTQAGNAQASGIMGASNALTGGVNNYMLYNALYK